VLRQEGKELIPERHAARFAGGLWASFREQKAISCRMRRQCPRYALCLSRLDYASIGPEHPFLRDTGRVQYTYATDDEALSAFGHLSRMEGITPALESAHAVAETLKLAPGLPGNSIIVVNLSGRGDKDVHQVAKLKVLSCNQMNRVEKVFKELRRKNRKAFIPYIMAGDPSLKRTKDTVLMLERCGADIVELGVSLYRSPCGRAHDPEGCGEGSESRGYPEKGHAFVKELRDHSAVPLLLMTYYNPVFKYGEERFLKDAVDAGINGVIIPDLPRTRRADSSGFRDMQTLPPYSSSRPPRLKTGSESGEGVKGLHLLCVHDRDHGFQAFP